jgi:NAD(P)-dependent dehydrogenase (short-subunit alcohol dehydrogenase family)
MRRVVSGTVLITGASTGLGRVTALHLAAQGFTVYGSVLDLRDREALEAPARERGLDVRVLGLDVTRRTEIDDAVATIVRETGRIDALVNNAGTRLRGCFEDLTDAEIRRLFETNLYGTMALTRAVLPHMRRAGRGRIVMVTSVAGRIGSFGVSAYCSSKFAQEGFGESLAQEVAPLGIDVILVEPGIIRTEAWSENRVVGAGVRDQTSPYCRWFRRSEELADRMVRSSTIAPEDVARTIHRALTIERPRLRYVVGPRAKAVIALRRHLPATVFERVYFGQLIRIVTRAAP